jgi:hypothetical protein
MSTTIAFRRFNFIAQPPVAGQFIRNKSGKGVLHVSKVTTFRRAGEPISRDTIKMEVSKTTPPDDVEPGPWPIAAKVVPTPPMPSAAVEFRAVVAQATKSVIGPKSAPGTWRDPDDDTAVRSRAPRMVRGGYRRCDPLVMLAKRNSAITLEHVLAGDAYRLQWEKATGGGSGSRSLAYTDRQFAASMGPSEIACQSAMAWDWTQHQLSDLAKRCLDAVVLRRQSVTAWALAIGACTQWGAGQSRDASAWWVGSLGHASSAILHVGQTWIAKRSLATRRWPEDQCRRLLAKCRAPPSRTLDVTENMRHGEVLAWPSPDCRL